MAYRILINREECEVRVAFLENQQLVELHTEKFDEQTIVNNLYRGKVQDVVPGLQAVFVDVGLERNMFLHFMDIRPEALVLSEDDQADAVRKASKTSIPGRIEKKGRRPRQDPRAPQAASPVKRGDDIIVQVLKDEISGKAPRVTSNLALAGRYLVMLPFPSQEGGVSRKIATGQERYRLKKLLSSLKTQDYSFIVRTVGLEQDEEALRRDADNLKRQWANILSTYKRLGGPGLLSNDHKLIVRLVRDAFPADFDEVICDDANDARDVAEQLDEMMPEKRDRVKVYDGIDNLFEYYDVESQIDKALDNKYWLKSGGSLVIDEMEALTAIDINTGRFTGKSEQEKTSLKTNIEACEAVARQIRLRDIGGIIVIDFIDMLSRANQDRVVEEMKRQLRRDRAKTAISARIGEFGLLVLTRKRKRMSLKNQVFSECPYCKGTGTVKRADEIFRRLKYDLRRAAATDRSTNGAIVSAHPRLIDTLTSRFRSFFEQMKREERLRIVYQADPDFHMEDYQITPMKRPDDDTPRLVDKHVEPAERILPPVIDILEEPTEPLAPETEKEPDAIVSSVSKEEPEEEKAREEEARRKRESSSERRARRRRARGRRGDKEKEPKEAASEADTAEVKEIEPPSQEKPAAVKDETEEEGARRKTRRGTRGGRGRQKRTEQDQAQQEIAKAEEKEKQVDEKAEGQVEAPPPAPSELPPLKLPARKSADADFYESFLNQIEEKVKTLDSEAPVGRKAAKARKEDKPARRAPRKSAAKEKKDREHLGSVLDKIEEELKTLSGEPAPEEAQEKKPARKTTRRTPAKPKKAVPNTEKATPEAAEEEKPKKKTTARRRTTRKKTEEAEKPASTVETEVAEAGEEAREAVEKKATRPKRTTTTRKSSSSSTAKKTTASGKRTTTTKQKEDNTAAEEKPRTRRRTTTRRKKTTGESSE